jgi:hypothetical protein
MKTTTSTYKRIIVAMITRSRWEGKRLVFNTTLAEIQREVGLRSRTSVRKVVENLLAHDTLKVIYQSRGRTASEYVWVNLRFVAAFCPEKVRSPAQKHRNRQPSNLKVGREYISRKRVLSGQKRP